MKEYLSPKEKYYIIHIDEMYPAICEAYTELYNVNGPKLIRCLRHKAYIINKADQIKITSMRNMIIGEFYQQAYY